MPYEIVCSLFLDISSRFLRSAASRSSFFRSALILAWAESSESTAFFDGFEDPTRFGRNYMNPYSKKIANQLLWKCKSEGPVTIQGDPSSFSLGFVDIKRKVEFQYLIIKIQLNFRLNVNNI